MSTAGTQNPYCRDGDYSPKQDSGQVEIKKILLRSDCEKNKNR